MIIFSAQQGRISRFVSEAETTDATIVFPGFNYTRLQTVITTGALQFVPSYQATDTLGNDIHLVTFGESLAPINLQGVIFDTVCNDRGTTPQAFNFFDDINGFGFNASGGVQGVIEWWQRENMTRRNAPVQLVIGASFSVRGYIANFSCQANASDKLWRFNLQILRVPPRREINDARISGVPRPAAPAALAPVVNTTPATISRVPAVTDSIEPAVINNLIPLNDVEGWDPSTTPLKGAVTGT